ncbi:M48 family metalloprotease, partial [Candidatus Bathyarchaeota archaeon]|nr:M48 family metalloprotease [Candidatus Bathyarchaeota archaeon]
WLVNFTRMVGTRTPTLYTTDRIEYAAFSIHGRKPGVCISKRVLEMLSPEEIKAILIHEIAHIRMKTQILKVSLTFLRILTPFSLVHPFLAELRSEENRADEYVRKSQGTSAHLDSAKNKIARIMLSKTYSSRLD